MPNRLSSNQLFTVAAAILLLFSILSVSFAQEKDGADSTTAVGAVLPLIIGDGKGQPPVSPTPTVSPTVSPTPIANAAPQIVSGEPAFTKQVIDDTVGDAHSVVAADFDQDGDMDVAATDYIDGAVLWYQNDGQGGFVNKVLDGDLEGAYPSHVADVDLDGRMDVLAGGYLSHTFAWYHNDGGGAFTRYDIDTAAMGAHSIVTSDMDEDGDIDFVTATQDEYSTIAWYENDGAQNFTIHPLFVEERWARVRAKRADVTDMDGDGDLDIVAASYGTNEISWFENDGEQDFTRHVINTNTKGAYFVSMGDIDGDTDIDIFTASKVDNTIAWLRNDNAGGFTRQIIDAEAKGARTALAADVDGDGDLDVLAASVDDDTIAWHDNDGLGNFTMKIIDQKVDGPYGLFAIDFDYDGDLDLLSASRNAAEVALHTQVQAHETQVEQGSTLLIDETQLLAQDTDNGPAELTYTITFAPQEGQLQLNNAPLTSGSTFTQADVNNGRVLYQHAGQSLAPDFFAFTLSDGGANGVQPAEGFFNFNIISLLN
jgi:hypothetical protein